MVRAPQPSVVRRLAAQGDPSPAGDTAAVSIPGSGLIPFVAPVDAAARIQLAASGQGGLYLALVPRGNKPVKTPAVIGKDQLYTGTLTPCGNDKSCSAQ